MGRPWLTWLLYVLCVAALFGAVAWVSATAIRLDRADAESRCQAEVEERARLTLWRMDSTLAPFVAQEGARPASDYDSFPEWSISPVANAGPGKSGPAPSPLLASPTPNVLLYFQFVAQAGVMRSPQVPIGPQRDFAEGRHVSRERIETSAGRLSELRGRLFLPVLDAVLPRKRLPTPAVNQPQPQAPQTGKYFSKQADQSAQYELNAEQFQARNQAVFNANTMQQAQSKQAPDGANRPEDSVMTPLWIGGDLLLARRVRVRGQETIQGCWLDWGAIKASLIADAKALLPEARLEPVAGKALELEELLAAQPEAAASPAMRELGYRLASLPVKLVPGALPVEGPAPVSPIWFSLVIAWGCVVIAAAGGALAIHGAVSLSERRTTFVSAVTHELRTPLTTLRMYTEMLAEKMVSGEEKRQEYLDTLSAEATRLSHLVENVMTYARVERRRAAARLEAATLEELVSRQMERLQKRAEQSQMRLVLDPGEGWRTEVKADLSMVEQVLFNLVDNACKYAAGAKDRRIHVRAECVDGPASLSVCDHGPGLSRRRTRGLFRPFHKSAHAAAESAPGVGLGLALSRRLARSMGGDLRLRPSTGEGACFALLLPRA